MFLNFVVLVAVAGLTFPACLMIVSWLINLCEKERKPKWLDLLASGSQGHNGKGQERKPAFAPVKRDVDRNDRRGRNG